jgi:predicted transcriptional regulator
MTTTDLAAILPQQNKASVPARTIASVYCGDLLSHVMGSAPEGAAWVTVMNNINVIAVASLTDVACVIIAGGGTPATDVLARADEQGIAVFSSADQVFETALAIHGNL